MGVKSTRYLSREEAERKYRELHAELYPIDVPQDNEILECDLEVMNDRVCGGEGFENYIIEEENGN